LAIVSIKSISEKSISSAGQTGDGLWRIEFSDGTIISFKTCYLPQDFKKEYLFISGNNAELEISSTEKEQFLHASACLRAEKTALRLIARAEQNTFNLTRKLEKRGHDPVCAHAAISRLCGQNLLDDRRYACLWLESNINSRTSSPRRLLSALNARGINRDDAKAALSKVLNNEAEAALIHRFSEKLKRKKNKTGFDGDNKRHLSYLFKSEGFSYQAVQRFLFDS